MKVVSYVQLNPFSLPFFYHLLREMGLMHTLEIKTIKMLQISTATSFAGVLLHNEGIISRRKLKNE